jgi:hypothetical protein
MRIRLEPPRTELGVPAPLHSDYLHALKIDVLPVFGIVRQDGILVVSTVDRWNHLFRSKPPELVPGDVLRLGFDEAHLVAYTPDYELTIPSHEKEIMENRSKEVRLVLPSGIRFKLELVWNDAMAFVSEYTGTHKMEHLFCDSKRAVILPPHSRVSIGNRIVVETRHRISWIETQSIFSDYECDFVYCTADVFFDKGGFVVQYDKSVTEECVRSDCVRDERPMLRRTSQSSGRYVFISQDLHNAMRYIARYSFEYALILKHPLSQNRYRIEPFGAVTLMYQSDKYRLGLALETKEEPSWLRLP